MDKRLYCDCGKPLEYQVDMVVPSVKFPITKKGEISKRPVKGTDSLGSKGQPLNFGCLICECGNQYEYNWSKAEKRSLRGKLLL